MPVNLKGLTAVQVVSLVTAVIGVLIAFGVNISAGEREALLAVIGVVASVVFGGASVQKAAHVKAAAAVKAAQIHAGQ